MSRNRLLSVLSLAAVLLSANACVSAGYLAPVLLDSEVERDSLFTGMWRQLDETGAPSNDSLPISADDAGNYILRIEDDSSEAIHEVRGRLGWFAGRRVLEIEPIMREYPDIEKTSLYVPVRYLFIIERLDAQAMEIAYVDPERLRDFLDDEPTVTPHLKTRQIDILLTGDSLELRRFFADYLARPGVLAEERIRYARARP